MTRINYFKKNFKKLFEITKIFIHLQQVIQNCGMGIFFHTAAGDFLHDFHARNTINFNIKYLEVSEIILERDYIHTRAQFKKIFQNSILGLFPIFS